MERLCAGELAYWYHAVIVETALWHTALPNASERPRCTVTLSWNSSRMNGKLTQVGTEGWVGGLRGWKREMGPRALGGSGCLA